METVKAGVRVPETLAMKPPKSDSEMLGAPFNCVRTFFRTFRHVRPAGAGRNHLTCLVEPTRIELATS